MSADTGWLHGEPQPLVGAARVSPEDWAEAAIGDRDAFELGLRQGGLPEPEVGEALDLRDEVAAQAALVDRRMEDFRERTKHIRYLRMPDELEEMIDNRLSIIGRLREWFSGRSFRVDAAEDVDLRVPLFVLAAADAAGCTASVETKQESEEALEWGITVFGTGLGGSAKITVSASSKFTAAKGEIKVVFLPASITVEKGTMLRDGRPAGEGYRVDASKLRTTAAPGLLLLAPGTSPPIGDVAERFPLSGDTSGAVATYTYDYERSRSDSLSLGAKAFGVDVSLKAKVELSSSVTLAYGLAGGADYELHRLAEGDGLVWARVLPAPASSA